MNEIKEQVNGFSINWLQVRSTRFVNPCSNNNRIFSQRHTESHFPSPSVIATTNSLSPRTQTSFTELIYITLFYLEMLTALNYITFCSRLQLVLTKWLPRA